MKANKLYLYSIVLVAVMGGLLFGYDTAVISGAEGGLQKFFEAATDFEYTKVLHGITSASALLGCVIGGALSGIFTDRLGRKKSLVYAGVMFFLSALGSWYPEFLFFDYGKPSLSLLIAFNFYRILGGVGVGLASAICPMYIGEIAPSRIRGMLVSWNQFAIIFGQLVVYFVSYLIVQYAKETYPDFAKWMMETGWRDMFVSEAYPAGLFTILIMLVPESPRYLAMIGKDDKALAVLSRINGSDEAQGILQDIKNTVEEKKEKLLTYGFMVIFIGIMLSVFQQAVGINAVLFYAPRIFESVGAGDPMLRTVIMGIVNISFTLVAVFTVDKFGRKPLLICGSVGMGIGALSFALSNAFAWSGMFQIVSIMLYAACFMFSWGPICWVLIAEIFPNTIRGGAVAIAVAFQWIFNFLVSSTFVPMYEMELTPGDGFGHVFAYALYGIICMIAAIFVWKLVPETKGKTLEDMTRLWKKQS
jgi:MFS transporter, SP family, xylose:H+ symportor